MFSTFLNGLYSRIAQIPFDTLIWLLWGSFGGLYVITLLLTVLSAKLRSAPKTPFLCLVNAYTGLTLACFLLKESLEGAVFMAAAFWVVGYLMYGVLRFFSRERQAPASPVSARVAISAAPASKAVQPSSVGTAQISQPKKGAEASAARMNVRLEHAITVTDRLLQKELGKTDRQELEKLKNTLAVLRVKGTLTPAEGEILNENFNTLLKLMAKYNV